jgi:hypothetical protein
MAGLFEKDTRNTQLRVYDYGDSVIRVYAQNFPMLDMLNSAAKGSKRRLKQVYSKWRVGTQSEATDTTTAEGVDKTGGYGAWGNSTLTGWAGIERSQGWMVTPTQEAIEENDIADEIVEQKQRDKESFMRAITRKLCSSLAQSDGSSSTRTTGGLFNWLHPAPSGSDAPPADTRVASDAFYTGALASLTETVFSGTVLKAIFGQTSRQLNMKMHAGLDLKAKMTSWGVGVPSNADAIATRIVNMSDLAKKWVNQCDFFKWDCGQVIAQLDVDLACANNGGVWEVGLYTAKSGLLLNLDMMPSIRYLRPIQETEQDPTQGGGRRGFMECELMLWVPAPIGNGAVFTNS